MGWLRLGYAAMFAAALTNLLDVAQLLGTSEGLTLPPEQLDAQVMMSLSSFHSGFEGIALAIFGLHLFALGYLVFKSTNFPRFLGALVAVAGAGYLFDSFGTILGPNYALTVGAYTFLGEVLLIFWLLWRAVKGFPADETLPDTVRKRDPRWQVPCHTDPTGASGEQTVSAAVVGI
jgi:hypothetical protein